LLMILVLALYVGAGSILALLSVPLILKKIRPNGWYGFRVKQTLENPRLWYAVNAFAGRRLFFAGIASVFAALILYFIPGLSLDAYALGCLLVTLLGLGVAIVQSALYLRKWHEP
jgi:hypothetical protein